MSLQDRIELDTQTVSVREGNGLLVGLTEPNGGEISLGIEEGEEGERPLKVVRIKMDAPHARDVAAALIELAGVVEGDSDESAS